MKRILGWLMGTVTVLVVLFSYRTSLQAVSADASTAAPPTATPAAPATATPAAPANATASASQSASSSGSQTFTGSSVDTRFGPVQVQITVSGGRITAANAVTYPTESGKDRQINARAVPTLNAETVTAQSSDIDMVSGATYTSQGYRQSLQSAIDAAHL